MRIICAPRLAADGWDVWSSSAGPFLVLSLGGEKTGSPVAFSRRVTAAGMLPPATPKDPEGPRVLFPRPDASLTCSRRHVDAHRHGPLPARQTHVGRGWHLSKLSGFSSPPWEVPQPPCPPVPGKYAVIRFRGWVTRSCTSEMAILEAFLLRNGTRTGCIHVAFRRVHIRRQADFVPPLDAPNRAVEEEHGRVGVDLVCLSLLGPELNWQKRYRI